MNMNPAPRPVSLAARCRAVVRQTRSAAGAGRPRLARLIIATFANALVAFGATQSSARAADAVQVVEAVLLPANTASSPVAALDESPSAPSATQPAPAADAARTSPSPAASLPGPKYAPLRFNDDFRYLDGPPGSYEPDIFDLFKNIRIGDEWRIRAGGEHRTRLEFNTNESLGSFEPTQDTYVLHRLYAHVDVQYRQFARVFIETVNAQVEDRDAPPRPIDENRWDFHQLFGDVRVLGERVPLTLRVGRQELLYGRERFVSPLDWANVRRRFDGVKLFWSDDTWNADFWYVRPIVNDLALRRNRELDRYDEDQHFYGSYFTYKKIAGHVIDGYFLALLNQGDPRNVNGEVGDLSVYTYGGRLAGKRGPWDYELESAGQFGVWAGNNVQAWTLALDGGYTFQNAAWTPRLGAGYDLASGDPNPNDEAHQTFNQLFPLGHAYLGFSDLVARQNISAPNVSLTLKPTKKLTLLTRYYGFWAYHLRDALYNAGGNPIRRNVNGAPGGEIGHEIDVTLNYTIDVHQSVLLGWSHFWAGEFVRSTGPSDNEDFFYLMYTLKF